MAIYVDPPIHNYGRMIMCHMVADTHEELVDMADKIGVQQKWIQNEGQKYEHFDISKSKRAIAIKNGAIVLTSRELVIKLRENWNEYKRLIQMSR